MTPVAVSQPPYKSNGSAVDVESLKAFLIRFVVEQTGYPEDVVDLDSDLEADLGIDSIKKAQMFGEIGEQFQIAPPSGNVTLGDFPTLRHVLQFIEHGPAAETLAASAPCLPASAGSALPATVFKRAAATARRAQAELYFDASGDGVPRQ